MTGTVGIVGGKDKELEGQLRALGLRPSIIRADQLSGAAPVSVPDVILVDLRDDRRLLPIVATIKQRYPAMGVAIIAASLDPQLMLEAMRAGVSECIAEPITPGALESGLGRIMARRTAPVEGRVFAIIGAKGGVGATTVAVNLAEALARSVGEALLIDLNLAFGDAAVFLGVEPRFTIVEALENTQRLDETFFRGLVVHSRSGLDLLASSTRVATGTADPQRVRTVIDFAVRYYRSLVLDVPRSDPSQLDVLDSASSIFVVVNQELPTVRSAYRLVGQLRQRYGGDRIGLLVNRADPKSEITMQDIEKAVNAKVRYVFPSDYKQALAAVNKGQPLAESAQGRLAGSFHAFAKTLMGQGTKGTPDDAGGLFGWLSPRRSTSA